MTSAPAAIRAWDLPTRIFHWTLALLVIFSFTTGKAGGAWMEWHLRSGFAILALLAFRVTWGFVGSRTSRFTHFLRGPRAAIAYARETIRGHHPYTEGHNPLGGWMVVFMLAALLLQAATGLFADDEIATQGPLAAKFSNALVARMTAIHKYNEWVIVGAVVLHTIAIAAYQWGFRVDLVRPMVLGSREAEPMHASNVLAVVIAALAAFLVYWLVMIYPRS